jgi:hypothetical protein
LYVRSGGPNDFMALWYTAEQRRNDTTTWTKAPTVTNGDATATLKTDGDYTNRFLSGDWTDGPVQPSEAGKRNKYVADIRSDGTSSSDITVKTTYADSQPTTRTVGTVTKADGTNSEKSYLLQWSKKTWLNSGETAKVEGYYERDLDTSGVSKVRDDSASSGLPHG